MRRIGLVAGVILIGGALMAAATAAEAQEATRVAPFEMLDGPRIGLPADASDAPMRELCPDDTEMCRRYWDYTGYFVRNASIPAREREIVILRTAWLSRGDYIWGRHDVIGKEAGLTPEEIARVTEGPDAEGWSDFDRALLQAVDDLHGSRFVSHATWDTLGERYTETQLVEVVLIVGNYTQLSMFQNSLGAQLPEGTPGLPDDGGQ